MSPETNLADIIPLMPDKENRRAEFDYLNSMAVPRHTSEHSERGSWEVLVGSGMLFSAPHEAAHFRDGAEKSAEADTRALAFGLARSTGGSAIATLPDQLGDPNWDIDHPYVNRVRSIATDAPVLDFHIMRPRGVELCIGLGPVPGLSEDLSYVFVEEAISAGLRVSINWPFGANERTVTGQLQKRGHKAIQLELSWECFDPAHPAMIRAWSAMARASRRLSLLHLDPRSRHRAADNLPSHGNVEKASPTSSPNSSSGSQS